MRTAGRRDARGCGGVTKIYIDIAYRTQSPDLVEAATSRPRCHGTASCRAASSRDRDAIDAEDPLVLPRLRAHQYRRCQGPQSRSAAKIDPEARSGDRRGQIRSGAEGLAQVLQVTTRSAAHAVTSTRAPRQGLSRAPRRKGADGRLAVAPEVADRLSQPSITSHAGACGLGPPFPFRREIESVPGSSSGPCVEAYAVHRIVDDPGEESARRSSTNQERAGGARGLPLAGVEALTARRRGAARLRTPRQRASGASLFR